MAPRKRARTSSTGGSSSSDASVTTIKLSGGQPCPSGQVSLLRAGLLTDTTVTVEGRSFDTNKLVLAASCEYFRSHFLNEQMERGAANPTLQEHVSAAAFEPLLDFLYEGECSFDETRLTEVLQAASFLTVKPLEQAAAAALSERLSPANALAAWSLADQLSLPELSEAAKVTALKGFEEVEKIEEATLAQVQALVADERLTAKSEEAVFSAVARFAEAKQPSEAELLGLLRNVRFALMSSSFLYGIVRDWHMLDTKAGQRLLMEMCMPLVSGPAQQPRTGFGARYLYVMGGSANLMSTDPISTVEIYDLQTNTWATGTPMPKPCCAAAATVLGGKIYFLGGFDGASTNSVNAFDPRTGAWAAVAPMTSARQYVAAAEASGKIYALGGSQGPSGGRQSSVEAFDPQTGEWAAVAQMPADTSRSGGQVAAALDGKIYVVGGSPSVGLSVNRVDVYDPQTNTWATAPPMHSPRRMHAAAALGGKIYVAGGYDNAGRTASMEAFDPRTSTWTVVVPMGIARTSFTLTAARGKLYVAGGVDASGNIVATTELYDPQQDRWQAMAPMANARRVAAAVCM